MHSSKEDIPSNKYEHEYLDLSSLEEGSMYNMKSDVIKKFLRTNTGKVVNFTVGYIDKKSPRIKEEEKKLQYMNIYDYNIDFVLIFELENKYLHIIGNTYEDDLIVTLFCKKESLVSTFNEMNAEIFNHTHGEEDVQKIEKPELFVFV
jgi:hypothetical protein